MKKWEKDYADIKAGKLDEKMSKLMEKVDDKTANREDFAEIKKISIIKKNISKIDNILEYRDLLIAKAKEIEDQIKDFKEEDGIDKIQNEIIELETKMTTMQFEKQTIEEQLKDSSLEEKTRNKLVGKLSDINTKMNENNVEFMKKQQVLDKSKENTNKFKDIDVEALKKTKMELSQKISKCNMIANNLIQGKSWDYVEYTLDNWKNREFKSDKKIQRDAKPLNRESKEKDQKAKEEENVPEVKEDLEENTPEVGTDLEAVSEFDLKHPRLAKIKNWIKTRAQVISNRVRGRKLEEIEESQEIEKPEKPQETEKSEKTEQPKKDNEFKEYIKKIAEKGIDTVEKEDKEEKMKTYKEAAYKREKEKFGKEYAQQSYKTEDDKNKEL